MRFPMMSGRYDGHQWMSSARRRCFLFRSRQDIDKLDCFCGFVVTFAMRERPTAARSEPDTLVDVGLPARLQPKEKT